MLLHRGKKLKKTSRLNFLNTSKLNKQTTKKREREKERDRDEREREREKKVREKERGEREDE